MSSWLELSYNQIYLTIKNRKIIEGTKKLLHPDALGAYYLIEDTIKKYDEYPRNTHFKNKLNLDLRNYKTHFSQKELSDELKSAFYYQKLADTQKEIQKLLSGEELISSIDVSTPINKLLNTLSIADPIQTTRLSNYKKIIKDYYSDDSETRIAKFGFKSCDRFTGGIHSKQYIIIYAQTSEGKSTFARAIAGNVALQSKSIMYISLEESAHKSVIKTLSTLSQFSDKEVFDRQLKAKTYLKMKKKMNEVEGDVIFIDKLEQYNVTELKQLANEHKPDIIVIDQIPLFSADGDPDWKEITKISRMIKQFTQNVGIPVIALTQATRKNKKEKPTIEDSMSLAYAVGQDADIVFFLHPTDTDANNKRKKVTLVKNRDRERYQSFELQWDLNRGIVKEVNHAPPANRTATDSGNHYADFA